ncbi:pimeloyl-ACP methyl ester carboxylesterase [Thioclava sp. ES.031]|uniref:alpha/beta fold hydrolase n=1 Tax=Thioclava sp. ES.031 TaxID=1798203 RepID=UPI000BF2C00A|nr:alpha/beta hydrolase [Thioclava sp. ES.031]PFG64205.1 pimeloyl-ACP methyl ester carboxylesterase [Thioclava sp. ES.031]
MEFFTADDGAKIAYSDSGSGMPILALSGLTRNTHDYDYVAPHLKGVRFICMDYRGRGESDWSGGDTYTVPREAADALQLLDHLGLEKAAILGTSRGGLVGMFIALTAKDRLTGLALNDIGPVLEEEGLNKIFDYIGRNPAAKTYAEMAEKLPEAMIGFDKVPPNRWAMEVRHHYVETEDGLKINYDPALREAFIGAFKGLEPAWPLFEATEGLPLALIHGVNSDLLSDATAEEMQRRRPDMIYARVADRAHIPFLDEPEALAALEAWIERIKG